MSLTGISTVGCVGVFIVVYIGIISVTVVGIIIVVVVVVVCVCVTSGVRIGCIVVYHGDYIQYNVFVLCFLFLFIHSLSSSQPFSVSKLLMMLRVRYSAGTSKYKIVLAGTE